VLNMCDLFEDDYKEFVLGELTELWGSSSRNFLAPISLRKRVCWGYQMAKEF